MNAKSIIQSLGGGPALADALGHATPATVASWAQRNSIPSRQWAAVVAAAEVRGVKLTIEDLHAAQQQRVVS